MRHRAVMWVAAGLLCLPTIASTQDAPARTPDRAKVLAAAVQLIGKARHSALITVGLDGHPQSRIVDPFAPEADMTVWIATNPVTRKVEQIKKDPRVTLFYFDPVGPGYVTLLARAELVTDPVEKAKHWKEDWTAFYKDKNRGEDYVLIRCKPFRLELVSYPEGILNDPATWRPVAIEFP